ncbi:type II inositol 1,4,5-trisphosphate 5-phosphatase [Poecilia formosa]|uniref:type II inositol 1,4,5-trisphosphate 5-phosphatase n=1 Tax=Poecilia formosa TaxID=48698 RepID=UPI0007BA2BFC|nr:PREDICTED: type II inositol 1,4,5-trisphosphate 5-phosphatase [Poecilia formosa]
MDQSVAIQETLGKEENCIVVSFEPRMKHAAQCDILLDDCSENRLLGLVECAKEHAIFIYTHRRMAITADDVSLEDILPITLDFAVVEVSSPEQLVVVGADTRVRMSYKNEELELRLPFGSHSRLFLCEVNKAWSDVCRLPTQVPKFEWIKKYKKSIKRQEAMKQAIAPLEVLSTKNNQHQKIEKVSDKKGSLEKVKSSNSIPQKSKGNSSQDKKVPVRSIRLSYADYYFFSDRFFLGTYNVNGQTPKESLRPWLSCTPEPPDIYCLGFQELDLSKEAFFFSDTTAKYSFLALIFHPSQGNKGAVAIRFRFHNSDICVVNSHLAAHVEEYERRNQDFKDICSRLQFRQLDPTQPPLTILKHNVVLWIGDLNYRISDLDVDRVKDLIAKNDYETLHSYDQLKRQIDVEAVFVGFKEGEIDFQPTYKYDTGSDKWDTSEKCRIPAWCDRILWKGKNIQQEHYKSHMDVRTSDHKPVSSLLVIGIKRVNPDAYKKTFEEIVRNIDKMENECIPSLSLSKREFHFKDVKFMQHHAETLNLFNDGQVPCQFEFIQKPNESTYSKPWLTANPPKGFIAQGASMDVDLEVFVNRSMAPDLNCGKQEIEDILVLHLERGKDYFISVTGNYLPSCYGTSIYSLCHMKEPIQDMPKETLLELAEKSLNDDAATDEKPLDIPKELWMMVDHLFRNAVNQEDIFQQPGLRTEFAEIRDCLDSGMPDSLPGSNHSVAEALLLFLDALPEPVIPFSFYQQCLECSSSAGQCEKIISMLPPFHKNVFNYLAAFLRELLKNSANNRLEVDILATIFASLLLRSTKKQDLAEKKKTQEFFQHFLTQHSS